MSTDTNKNVTANRFVYSQYLHHSKMTRKIIQLKLKSILPSHGQYPITALIALNYFNIFALSLHNINQKGRWTLSERASERSNECVYNISNFSFDSKQTRSEQPCN